MNRDYALKSEENDYFLLDDFNRQVLHLTELGQTPKKHHTDASGYTTDGRYCNIELKYRDAKLTDDFKMSAETYTVDSIFIENHKVGDMLLDYVINKEIPLYINFFQDGYVALFNLSRLKHRPNKVTKKIYSKLYQGFELAKREELLLIDAWIYRKENDVYKLIRKPC